MAYAVDYSKKSIIFITGASRGIGQTIAIEIAKRINHSSIFVLLARSLNGLEETKNAIINVNKNVRILTHAVDLAKPELNGFNDIFNNVLTGIDSTGIEYGYIFHNAGDIGILKNITDITDITLWQKYYDLNLFSTILLNNVFMKKIQPIASHLVVINMTSICGRKPYPTLAMYGSGKAARQLFFQVFAEEQGENITVLNYSPGPVKTDMFLTVCDKSASDNIRNSFQEVRNTSVLTTQQTVEKLLGILEKGDYKSGDVIDYYD